MKNIIPELKRHKGKALGYTRVRGHFTYFGRWPDATKPAPDQVRQRYEAWLMKYLRGEDFTTRLAPLVQEPTLNELWAAYQQWMRVYYVKDGVPTSEVGAIANVCQVVVEQYGHELVKDFALWKLLHVRNQLIAKGWSRRNINKQISRVRGMFKWAVMQGKCPFLLLEQLKQLPPLKKGRSNAREKPRIQPVGWAVVAATIEHLRQPLPDLIRVHWLLGCRAQHVCAMRACDLHTTPDGRHYYAPPVDKGEHREDAQDWPIRYWIGPKAWAILEPRVQAAKAPTDWLFPTRKLRGDTWAMSRYKTASYRRAVARVCQRQNLEHWCPLQIRHARLTEVREHAGIEAAAAVGNHRSIKTTEIYAERNQKLAAKVMEEMG